MSRDKTDDARPAKHLLVLLLAIMIGNLLPVSAPALRNWRTGTLSVVMMAAARAAWRRPLGRWSLGVDIGFVAAACCFDYLGRQDSPFISPNAFLVGSLAVMMPIAVWLHRTAAKD
jgi:hypothetical protein